MREVQRRQEARFFLKKNDQSRETREKNVERELLKIVDCVVKRIYFSRCFKVICPV